MAFVIDPSIKPKFCAARPVPYALRDELEEELARMQKERIIKPVAQSQWASPIVVVQKQDGSVRVCGDYERNLEYGVCGGSVPTATNRGHVHRTGRVPKIHKDRLESCLLAVDAFGGSQAVYYDQHTSRTILLHEDAFQYQHGTSGFPASNRSDPEESQTRAGAG